MRESEFWSALELAFGPVLGRSLAFDLHLSAVDATAAAALQQGADVERVWLALIDETGADDRTRWIHRLQRPKRS